MAGDDDQIENRIIEAKEPGHLRVPGLACCFGV